MFMSTTCFDNKSRVILSQAFDIIAQHLEQNQNANYIIECKKKKLILDALYEHRKCFGTYPRGRKTRVTDNSGKCGLYSMAIWESMKAFAH